MSQRHSEFRWPCGCVEILYEDGTVGWDRAKCEQHGEEMEKIERLSLSLGGYDEF